VPEEASEDLFAAKAASHSQLCPHSRGYRKKSGRGARSCYRWHHPVQSPGVAASPPHTHHPSGSKSGTNASRQPVFNLSHPRTFARIIRSYDDGHALILQPPERDRHRVPPPYSPAGPRGSRHHHVPAGLLHERPHRRDGHCHGSGSGSGGGAEQGVRVVINRLADEPVRVRSALGFCCRTLLTGKLNMV
jgi:hypothetical protein